MSVQRVMISSTAKDLPHHRKAVMDACLSQGMLPKMMEHLPASDADAVHISLKMVEETDLYIGIFAYRYGYIPAGYEVSITELEYRRAVEKGLPCLIFMMSPNHADHNEFSHTQDDPAKLERLKTDLLKEHVVRYFQSPDDLRAEAINTLSYYRLGTLTAPNDAQRFSAHLRHHFAQFNRTVETLTHDQYEILQLLRYQKRVAIAGCAGSGKTLLAVEKALQLDKSGLRTLLICHNQYLAQSLQKMVSGTGVTATDFTTWVGTLTGQAALSEAWTHYHEPTNDELTAAFDILVETSHKFDAVIVDEGQDFRADWWVLLEAALMNPESGFLYVFHDDNQTLLPYRAQYPITQAPYVLTKNCRNAGKIFDWVKKLHPQSPNPTVDLQQLGIVEQFIYPSQWAKRENQTVALQDALQSASLAFNPAQLVVLTTEPEPIATSSLERFHFEILPNWQWQTTVRDYLGKVALSSASYPTTEDIQTVQQAAIQQVGNYDLNTARLSRIHWMAANDQLALSHPFGKELKRAVGFFTQPDWADGIPRPPQITLTSTIPQSTADHIRLLTVSAFKGLEADGVILVAPHPYHGTQTELEAHIYVGLSRARFLLYLVIDRQLAIRLPHVMLSYHDSPER